jgi:hypothetical protein
MRTLLLLTALTALALPATADVISTVPAGATTVTFDGGPTCVPSGPQTVTDAGFSMSSDGDACFSYSGFWNLDDNGYWDNLPLIGDYSGSTTITINLGGLHSYVGGDLNFAEFSDWTTGNSPAGNDPVIAALDANGQVIESIDIFTYLGGEYTDVNASFFLGISETTPEIAAFQISGSDIAMTDLSMDPTAPEPATMMLSASGLLALRFLRRRKPVA